MWCFISVVADTHFLFYLFVEVLVVRILKSTSRSGTVFVEALLPLCAVGIWVDLGMIAGGVYRSSFHALRLRAA